MMFSYTLQVFLLYYGDVTQSANKSKSNYSNSVNDKKLYRRDLFEGDLKLPMEIIERLYNFSSIPGDKKQFMEYMNISNNTNDTEHQGVYRAALSETYTTYHLWPNKIVRYIMHHSLSLFSRSLIRRAIKHWEENTCLKFILATISTTDYIYFTNTHEGCYSSAVGQRGGKQIINLQRYGCEHFGTIVHEIGHAIGFWHEHSRPDRDRYIYVNTNNIDGHLFNFIRMNDFDIDYQGSYYDYGSIMHYGLTIFSRIRCSGSDCYTMSINNMTEYARQGKPRIGKWTGLSAQDILQTHRLYSCPCQTGTGVGGNLTLFIRYGVKLLDKQDILNPPNSYVKVTAVDCSGNKVVRKTRQIRNHDPEWFHWLYMGNRRWQFFRISVWDKYSTHSDYQLTTSQTVAVSSTRQYNQKHCKNYVCKGYIVFDYGVQSDYRVKSSVCYHNVQYVIYFFCVVFTMLIKIHIFL